jgi:hypothetical protein
MLFNDDLLFIHIGKTGGTSCSLYLLENLRGTVHYCHRNAAHDIGEIQPHNPRLIPHTDLENGRHSNLSEGLAFVAQLEGRTLQDFEKIIAVIRHPVTLEYSWYRHLQKPTIQESRKAWPRAASLAALSFEDFLQQAPYHRPGHPQERFFLLEGEAPPQLELIRFEQLASEFPAVVAPFLKENPAPALMHTNRTDYSGSLEDELTELALERVYRRHQWVFDRGYYQLDSLN